MLQDDGFSDASSVTVNQLNLPALNGSLSARGFDKPTRGGGVDACVAIERTKQDANPSAALGGELQAAGFDARNSIDSRDRRPDTFAAEAFGDRPVLIRCRFWMNQVKALERDAQ